MRRLVAALVVLLISAACGGSASSGAASATAVTLTDTGIQLDQPSAPAGTVTFTARNNGTVIHSLMLIKTDVAVDKLAADPNDASRVAKTGEVRETAQIPVGQTASFSANLAAGNYVLVCNEPGHYLIGMRTAFVVK
jgi:copper(I)-binding protein